MDIAPVNPMDWLFKIIAFGLMAFIAMLSNSSFEGGVSAPGRRVPHQIENVDIVVLESYPMQIELHVTGYQPDGCDFPVQVEQRRTDHTVVVEIFRVMPEDTMCPMTIESYDATIRIEGGFESGSYTFDVNGFVVEVDL